MRPIQLLHMVFLALPLSLAACASESVEDEDGSAQAITNSADAHFREAVRLASVGAADCAAKSATESDVLAELALAKAAAQAKPGRWPALRERINEDASLRSVLSNNLLFWELLDEFTGPSESLHALLVTGAKIRLYSGTSEWFELSYDPYMNAQEFDAHAAIHHTADGRDVDGLYALSDGPGGSIRIEFDTVPTDEPANDEWSLIFDLQKYVPPSDPTRFDYRMVITSGEGELKGRTFSSFPKVCRPSTPKADE